jgi:hypothetical protein
VRAGGMARLASHWANLCREQQKINIYQPFGSKTGFQHRSVDFGVIGPSRWSRSQPRCSLRFQQALVRLLEIKTR